MASILDVAPVPEIVRVRGRDFEVHGLSLEDLAALVARFPEVSEFFSASAGDADNASPMAFLKASPVLAAKVIGMAIRQESPEEIAELRKLPLGTSLAFLLAVKKGSLPDGPGPLEEVVAMIEPVITRWAEKFMRARSMASAAPQPGSPGAAATDTQTS